MKFLSLLLALSAFWISSELAAPSANLNQHGEKKMRAIENPETGQFEIWEDSQSVLQYNYRIVEAGALFEKISPPNLKYAKPRSDYIHPLYGLSGEELTADWSIDHPHHRGIYWAWPEVTFDGETGDLHALQKVFARPTEKNNLMNGEGYSQIEAENVWLWKDERPIVQEWTVIRAYSAHKEERLIDLEFHFNPLVEGITIARRETDKYGGLNIRLTELAQQEIRFAPAASSGGREAPVAWGEISGLFPGGEEIVGLSVIQNRSNPHYPGEWIEYPEINWLQPTFPKKNTRYGLRSDDPLVLRFRLWIHPGRKDAKEHEQAWEEYHQNSKTLRTMR